METTLRTSLEELTALFREATTMSPSSVAKRAINDNTFFTRLAKGEAGFNIRTYDRIVRWLSDNWPDGIKWPEHIERPTPADTVAA